MYRSAALAGLGLVFITGAAAAHPHVWIISKSEVIFDGDKVIAVRNIWAFDEMFSGFTVQGLDKNSDGTYTRETLQPIAEVSIGSIRNRKYYTVVKSRDTSARFDEPKDYWLEYDKEKGILTLHLTLPLIEPIRPKDTPFTVEVSDASFFVSFSLDRNTPVILVNAPTTCRASVESPPEENRPFRLRLSNKVTVSCQ